MKESSDNVAKNERNAISETAIRPLRWAKGNGSISSCTLLVNRGSSSREGWPRGMRLYRSIEAIVARLQRNRQTWRSPRTTT